MANIDNLDIQISASVTKANTSIDNLVDKLDELSTSLGKINGSSLTDFANGLEKLSSAMQTINNVDSAKFTSLANGLKQFTTASKSLGFLETIKFSFLASGINKIGNSAQSISGIDTSGISRIANSITRFSKIDIANLKKVSDELPNIVSSFNSMGSVSANAQQVGELANNLSSLGNKNITNAIQNIPLLATALRQLMATLSTAPMVSQNIIDMTNALANLAAQGGRVGTATNSIIGNLSRYTTASARATRKTFSLAAAFGRFYATYWLVIRGVKALYKSIESASGYIEAFNFYDVAANTVAKEWYKEYGYENAEAYADSFTDQMNDTFNKLSGIEFEVNAEGKGLLSETGLKNLGLNIQEVTQYAAQLISVTNSVGLTGKASLAAANSFTRLAGDISSLFNTDYNTAAKNLQSGLIGQSRALYKYGIDITNATLQTKAYELGLSKTVAEMTQAEKMQLRMLSILEQSKVAWGDLARTINNPANQIRMFKNQISELSQMIGQLFLPILSKIMPVLNGITVALKRLVGAIAGFFGIEIDADSIGQGFDDIDTGVDDLSDGLDAVTESAKKAKAGLRGFDELKTISMPDTSSADSSASGMIDLTKQIEAASNEYLAFFDKMLAEMEDKVNAIADKVEEFLQPLKDMFQYLAEGNYYAAGKSFSTFISNIFNSLADAINKIDWKQVGTNIGEFLAGFDEADVISAVSRFVKAVKDALIDIWTASFKEAPFMTLLLTGIFGTKLLLNNPIIQFAGKIIAEQFFKAIGAKLLGSRIAQSILGGMSTNLLTGSTTSGLFATLQAFGGTILGQIVIGIAAFAAGWTLGKWLYEKITGEKMDKSFFEYATEIAQTFPEALGYAAKDITQKVSEIKANVEEGFGYMGQSIKEKSNKAYEDIQVWWIKTKSEWKQGGEQIESDTNAMWQQLKTDWKQGWQNISDWWKNSTLVKWWNEDVAPWFTKEKWINVMGGIKEGFEYAWNDAIKAVKDIWNRFASWLNDKLTFNIPSFTNPFTGTVYQGSTIQLGKIPMYYNGGFPESASLFWSGENGVPELVGTVGGKSAVASGAEITGIRSEIRATANEEMVLLRQQNQLLQALLEKEYGISPDAIFKSVQKSARTYSARTGRSAFSY